MTHIVVWKRPRTVDDFKGSVLDLLRPEKASFRIRTPEEAEETRPDGDNWVIDEVYEDIPCWDLTDDDLNRRKLP